MHCGVAINAGRCCHRLSPPEWFPRASAAGKEVLGPGVRGGGRRAGPRPSPALPGLAVTSRRSRGSGIRVGFSCGGRNSSSLRAARADFCRRIRSEISSACGCRGRGAGMLRSLGDGRPRLALRTPGRVVPPSLPRPGPAPASPAGGRSAVGERGLGRGPRRP